MKIGKNLLLLTLIFFSSYTFASAKNSEMYGENMVTKTINVRSQAKIGNNRIGYLEKGSIVTVKKMVKNWCQIDYKKFKKAYVECGGLETISTTAPKFESEDNSMISQEKINRKAINYEKIPHQKNADGSWTLGLDTAPLKIEEFIDYQCEYCAGYLEAAPMIMEKYESDDIQYTVYHYPLGYHPQAQVAAEAAFCAGDQNKFWEMHDLLLRYQDIWSYNDKYLQIFDGFARNLKLDRAALKACITSEKFKDQIQKEFDEGKKREIDGVSAYFLNGEAVESKEILLKILLKK